MFTPFWTTKIWPGWQWGSRKVKIRSNKGQYGAICGHILTFPDISSIIISLHLRLTQEGSCKKILITSDDGLRPSLWHSDWWLTRDQSKEVITFPWLVNCDLSFVEVSFCDSLGCLSSCDGFSTCLSFVWLSQRLGSEFPRECWLTTCRLCFNWYLLMGGPRREIPDFISPPSITALCQQST